MEPRKILIVTNRIPYPLKDGGNLAMNSMINGYKDAGWQVYLLSMNTSRHHVAQKVLEKLYLDLYCFEWVNVNNDLNKIRLVKNYLFSKLPESVERFYKADFELKLRDVMANFSPNVVQFESVFLSSYLPVVNKFEGTIKVLRLHNVEYHIWQSLAAKVENRLKKIYFTSLTNRIRKYEKSSWAKYDLLLPITNKDAEVVKKRKLTNELLVAPFGIDLSHIPLQTTEEKWVGYHIGAMDWIPNREGLQWFLQQVWPKVIKSNPKFEFYFAGRDMPEELKKISIKNIYCLDEVPSAEEFIADKKILIVPLLSGSGIRVKILEAMAAGKVVITTVNGIKGIDARNGTHYLLANRPEDFQRTIKWCLDNKENAQAIADNARKLIAERYNNNKITQKIINTLESML